MGFLYVESSDCFVYNFLLTMINELLLDYSQSLLGILDDKIVVFFKMEFNEFVFLMKSKHLHWERWPMGWELRLLEQVVDRHKYHST